MIYNVHTSLFTDLYKIISHKVKATLLKQYVINKTLGSSTTSQIWKSVFLATDNKIQYRTQNS